MSNKVCYDSDSTAVAPYTGTSLSRWLDGFWDSGYSTSFEPRVEVRQFKDHYTVELEIPGVSKKDVHVEVKNGVLGITGQKRAVEVNKDDCRCYSDRRYGSFERFFRLPEFVDSGNIHARYHEGLLELTLPIREEARPKSIDVKIE